MIIKEQIYLTPFQQDRTLHIYLPDQMEEGERFPVLYMFDGHNLFRDEDATYGRSWGMEEYLSRKNSRLIVVGVECSHEGNERLSEYSPYDWYEDEWGHVPAKGVQTSDWMVQELKPYIDAKYPTLPDRAHTYIGGSSCGGTMAFYMVLMHSEVYSKSVVVSPHIYPLYKHLRSDLGHRMKKDTQVYISWGGQEYDPYIMAVATDQNLQIIRALMKKKGVDVIPHCFKNDNHSEDAWRKELPVWMRELHIG